MVSHQAKIYRMSGNRDRMLLGIHKTIYIYRIHTSIIILEYQEGLKFCRRLLMLADLAHRVRERPYMNIIHGIFGPLVFMKTRSPSYKFHFVAAISRSLAVHKCLFQPCARQQHRLRSYPTIYLRTSHRIQFIFRKCAPAWLSCLSQPASQTELCFELVLPHTSPHSHFIHLYYIYCTMYVA